MNYFEKTYQKSYDGLNQAQRLAVDTIEGPVLVVAGPGTGKTQLLATRTAHILKQTDSLPQNILCLTFTESAALTMRERLSGMLGDLAYDVKIYTYHSFGSDIIKNYPEYFSTISLDSNEETRLEKPIDDITKHEILYAIVDALPFDSPLKSTKYHLGDLISTISDLKKNLISAELLEKMSAENAVAIAKISPAINDILSGVKTMPASYSKAAPLFEQIQSKVHSLQNPLCKLAAQDLTSALDVANQTQKSTPLTKWKNTWLHKLSDNSWSFTDPKLSEKLTSLANVLMRYAAELHKNGLYDFDDMILRAIDALKHNDELRYNLQEKYLYVMLDEFQDTNAAQFELVSLLTNNPVHEGRPNILAVGDDDQAIYAFQGAEVSNMLHFTKLFRDVSVITLIENYRSHRDILHVAHGVSQQIETRLHNQIEGITKFITAANPSLPKNAHLQRHEFATKGAEYGWIAEQIKQLIDEGIPLDEIAVLSPKHSYLESLVPFLNHLGIPVEYEKRENILQTDIILVLRTMVEATVALHENDISNAAQKLAIVFSYPFWNIPIESLWQVNWQAASFTEKKSWVELAFENESLRQPMQFFMSIALLVPQTPLETMLDMLTGTEPLSIGEQEYTSPLFEHYFSEHVKDNKTQHYFETITYLSVIREKMRSYQQNETSLLTIKDFLRFIALYENAGQPLINSHPVVQSPQSVHLMTAFKSKGLEFAYVFLPNMHDATWGMSARSNSNKLSLPRTLQHIRYRGADEDEKLRILYVAITRAKQGLYLTSHTVADSGKKILPLKYLQEIHDETQKISTLLPENCQGIISDHKETMIPPTKATELLWHSPHTSFTPELKNLIKERLERYVMSPTHINTFIDLHYGGPQIFLLHTLLRFPKAPGIDGEYGTSIHETLDWVVKKRAEKQAIPSLEETIAYFKASVSKRYIPASSHEDTYLRGERALSAYHTQLAQSLSDQDVSEHDFRGEGIIIDGVHLTGKIDRLIVDKDKKAIIVVDYKTGQSYKKWASDLKLIKYRQQLYIYKLLVEHSKTFAGYSVTHGRLDFVEPDDQGQLNTLTLTFDETEMQEIKKLIKAIWTRITTLDFPDTAQFEPNKQGSLAFIAWLTQ